MNQKGTRALGLILGLVILSLFLVPMGSAAIFYDENDVMTSVSELRGESRSKYTGDDSKLTKWAVDYVYGNHDNNLTQTEIDNYENQGENANLGRGETQYTFIDGKRGHITTVDYEVSCPLGDVNTLGDFILSSSSTVTWSLEERTDHTYRREQLTSGNTVLFTVPTGWEIENVDGLDSKTVSNDKRTVTGVAITGTAHTVKFVKSATFQISGLSISQSEVEPNQPVTIALNVANVGGVQGTYTATLKVNGTTENTQEVTLAAGENRTVTFLLTKEDAGTQDVEVGGLTGNFSVKTPSTPINLTVAVIPIIIVAIIGALVFLKKR